MSVSASPPKSAAPPERVLADRTVWLLCALGLATGIPTGFTWYSLFPAVQTGIEQALLLSLTALGVIGVIELLAGPFLDRYEAPLFRRLGHRRSWLASTLAAAVALTAVYATAALIAPGLAAGLGTILGIFAVPTMALLWISLDALRIELRPGRAQAMAFGAQFIGALVAALIADRLGSTGIDSPLGFVAVVLLALGLAAALVIDEPAKPDTPPARAGFLATLAQPWSAFFARHGAAGKFLLAAIAFYALGAGVADYLGMQGYVIDIIAAEPGAATREPVHAARLALSSLELAFLLVGALAGMAVAGRLAPARAFTLLQYAVVATIAFFILCKLVLGFTVFTVAGLFALRTLVFAFGGVIFAVVAARLTARPHTAGQFALLVFFVALFSISDAGMNRLAPLIGSLPIAAGGIVAAIIALALMHLASGAARRAR